MGQHQVLLVADQDLVEAVALGQVGDRLHLRCRRVARHAADRLQRDADDGVARHLVRVDVAAHEAGELAVVETPLLEGSRLGRRQHGEGRRREVGLGCADLLLGQAQLAVADLLPLLLDQAGETPRRRSAAPGS